MTSPMRAKLVATWGVGLVLLLLASALYRLTPLALSPLRDGSLGWGLGAVYALWVVFNAYAEGWRGFHKKFSPRVVARAFHLGAHPRPLHVVLALPFCMSLFYTTKRQRIVSWTFTLVLTGVILWVRSLSQPWRGIIDGGVVVGLGLGVLSILYFYGRALMGDVPPEAALPPAGVDGEAGIDGSHART